ncbi:GNAT family N-acetyltransferase [Microbacterium trichothecenolyticum]|nr:GNAT family protein [Microbacterium trichothecenolyticum]MBW9121504.1 GNAT family N-acetyltransferase [Microbacterium trichothecenolyticum]
MPRPGPRHPSFVSGTRVSGTRRRYGRFRAPPASPRLCPTQDRCSPRLIRGASWAGELHRTWVIRDGATLVGTIGFYRLDGQGNGEIGYWVAPDQRGGGRLREAANAVIDWAFSSEGAALTRIEWRAVVGNEASARVARALGFRFEGTLRQALVSAKHRDDGWIAALLKTDERMPQPWPVLED